MSVSMALAPSMKAPLYPRHGKTPSWETPVIYLHVHAVTREGLKQRAALSAVLPTEEFGQRRPGGHSQARTRQARHAHSRHDLDARRAEREDRLARSLGSPWVLCASSIGLWWRSDVDQTQANRRTVPE